MIEYYILLSCQIVKPTPMPPNMCPTIILSKTYNSQMLISSFSLLQTDLSSLRDKHNFKTLLVIS